MDGPMSGPVISRCCLRDKKSIGVLDPPTMALEEIVMQFMAMAKCPKYGGVDQAKWTMKWMYCNSTNVERE